MNITYRGKDTELTDDLKAFADKKIGSLERLLGDGSSAHVEFSKDSNHHVNGDVFKVSVEVQIPGEKYHTDEVAKDFKAALNLVKDELQKQINAKKGANHAKRREAAKSVREMKAGL